MCVCVCNNKINIFYANFIVLLLLLLHEENFARIISEKEKHIKINHSCGNDESYKITSGTLRSTNTSFENNFSKR